MKSSRSAEWHLLPTDFHQGDVNGRKPLIDGGRDWD
jgi:hypothetical protein